MTIQASAQFRTDPDAALAGYRENGFHVEYDVWSPGECDRFIEAATACPGRQPDDYRPLMQPHRTLPLFLDALRKPSVVEVIERLLEGPASGLQTEFFFGRPGTLGFARHQDNFYLETASEAFASAWSALTDVAPQGGGLYLYPGSHREPILPTRPLAGGAGAHQDPNAANEETAVPAGYRAVDVELPKGSALFLHGHVVHGSHGNRSERFRYALLCTYIRRGMPFRAGRHARRSEVSLHDDGPGAAA